MQAASRTWRDRWFGFLTAAAALLIAAGFLVPGSFAQRPIKPPRPIRPPIKKLIPYDRWVERNDMGMIYHTTSHATDLDHAVKAGARILKYADGTYVHAIHKQYPSTCGPASLAMVLKQLGVTSSASLSMPRDVDLTSSSDRVDVGYRGSPEHLLWLGLHRRRLELDASTWNGGHVSTDAAFFMDRDGLLDTRSSGVPRSKLEEGRNMSYLSYADFPRWLWKHPGVGSGGTWAHARGLPGIMNYVFSGQRNGPFRDAMPLDFTKRGDADVVRYRRIVKGFIDHGIAVVLGVDDGGHFNALIGYKGSVSPASASFVIYTADPLDGWGRAEHRQPLRWRRMEFKGSNLRGGTGVIAGMICWNHHAAGGAPVNFAPSGWAADVDRQNGNDWLTGKTRQPPANDYLRDALTVSAQRMP